MGKTLRTLYLSTTNSISYIHTNHIITSHTCPQCSIQYDHFNDYVSHPEKLYPPPNSGLGISIPGTITPTNLVTSHLTKHVQ